MNPVLTCRHRMADEWKKQRNVWYRSGRVSHGNSRAPRTKGPLASRHEGTAKIGPSGWQGSGLRAWLVRRWRLWSRVVEAQERASDEIDDCSFRAPLFWQAGLACERALDAIRLRSSMHVSRRRRWKALAVRGVYDDLVYGTTRPFVAFQGSKLGWISRLWYSRIRPWSKCSTSE
jgi:hypothetical protein